MGALSIAGLVLIYFAVLLLIRGLNPVSRPGVLNVAVKITASQARSVPDWPGGLTMVRGVR